MKNTAGEVRTGVLVILDGFGINPSSEYNAVAHAQTPTLDHLLKNYPHTQIQASEQFVGLPLGFMGNSEVGHLNIGAGRVVFQDFSLISRSIDDGSFFKNPVFLNLTGLVGQRKGASLHLVGLVSDGGVHSHISHLVALLQLAKQQGILSVKIHVITDGRDTSPTSGAGFVETLENYCRDIGVGEVVTVMGRFYAMDRDTRWDRTQKAYDAMVLGKGEKFTSARKFIQSSYAQSTTDEFILPGVAENFSGIQDGDGVIFFNFRADRARQITRAFTQSEFSGFSREKYPVLSGYVCMTPYDESFRLPCAYEKPKVPATLGEVISKKGWKQLRIAETEKYAHVTYFFNGGDERVFDGEKRILIPSPREVKTYDLKPEMSALQVTENLLKELSTEQYGLVVVNFANTDMVGHTGNLSAAISAVEVVDSCLGKIVRWVETHGGFLVLTADHGNCEMMMTPDGLPLTSHTLLPVPFILVDPKQRAAKLREGGKLCDIAPTLLDVWGIAPPPEMTGESLIAASR